MPIKTEVQAPIQQGSVLWVMAHYARVAHLLPADQLHGRAKAICGERPGLRGWHEPYVLSLPPDKRCPICENLVQRAQEPVPPPPSEPARRPLVPVVEIESQDKETDPTALCTGGTGADHPWRLMPINRNGYHYCMVCWAVGPERS